MPTIRWAAQVPVLLAIAAGSAHAVSFPDYVPVTPAQYGVRTFTQTYGGSGGFVSQIVASASVPYTSGARSGAVVSAAAADLDSAIFSNDGNEVRLLGGTGFYVSSDLCLTSHSDAWAFGQLVDGQIIDQRPYYVVASDLSSSSRQDNQLILVEIQDVTVPNGTYQDAVIMWTLSDGDTYTSLSFDGRDASLGITLPGASRTNNYAVTAFDIYGIGGLIATGDVDASTGTLNELFELQSATVSVETGPELGYVLESSGPNPFYLQTSIAFGVPREGRVVIEIYDAGGRRVRTLADQVFTPGRHTSEWDGQDAAGHMAPAGIYVIRMKAGDLVTARKIVRAQ